jgi:hypothetical protein
MAQQHSNGTVTDMQTGGQRDEADLTLKQRAEAMAEQVQDRYGEEVADRSHRLRERFDGFEPGDAGRAVLRQAKGAQWPLLLIGGALGFGLAAWMGGNEPKPVPAARQRRRRRS